MRSIKYLLINDKTPKSPTGHANHHTTDNLGHHYVINSKGRVLNPIDVRQPGKFMPEPSTGAESLNQCSIGIKYNGKLTDPRLRSLLIALLLNLRERYPDAKILAKNEYDRHRIKVRDDMNSLRRELGEWW